MTRIMDREVLRKAESLSDDLEAHFASCTEQGCAQCRLKNDLWWFLVQQLENRCA